MQPLQYEADEERGAILLLLAFALIAIAAFLALVIDTSQVTGSQHKQHRTAELAALAALTGYQAATSTATDPHQRYVERLAAAIQRAETVIAQEENNLRLGTSGPQLAAYELKEGSGALDRGSGPAGTITPGTWFFEEPQVTCAAYTDKITSCPCGNGLWSQPCFRANTPADSELSAFEVTLQSKPDNPIHYVFGRVLGGHGASIRSRGRASVKPRLSITGIDLSLSVTGDDNIDWDDLDPSDPRSNFARSSAYVFPLDETDPGSRCKGEEDYTNPCLLDPAEGGYACRFKAHSHFGPMWYHLQPDRYAIPGFYPRTTHFRNDYSCWIVDGRHFLIDTSVHPFDADGDSTTSEGVYYGPEPLISILHSFGQTLEEVQKRAVPGDEIALFGFDRNAQLGGPRFLGPGNPSDDDLWQEFKDLTDVTGVNDLRGDVPGATPNPILKKRLRTHQFFPQPPDSFTDLAGAIFAASQTVEKSTRGSQGTIDLTLLTDGLSTVSHLDGVAQKTSSGWEMLPDNTSACTSNDRYVGLASSCWFAHNEAVYDAVSLVTWDPRFWMLNAVAWWNYKIYGTNGLADQGWVPLQKRGFRINIGLFSKDVQPHVLLKKGTVDPNKCLTDAEARKSWRPLFLSGDDDDAGWDLNTCYTTLGAPDACPYTPIADVLYRGLVVPTGGFFIPVRPACDPARINAALPWNLTTNSCADGALEDKLDSELCAQYTSSFEQYGHTYDFTVAYQPNLQPMLVALQEAGVVDTAVDGVVQDGTGTVANASPFGGPPHGGLPPGGARTVCDTRCRTPEQQLREMVQTIFNSNPYVLVRDDT